MKTLITICTLSILFGQGYAQKTTEEWRTIIDSTWGQGLPIQTKLQIFDYAYNAIDRDFACFQGLNVDMDSLRDLYRPEIEAGVSRGRFAAIMNYFALSFKEGHNWIIDGQVNSSVNTIPAPGTPLFVVGAWSDNSHFGATLTPLPDSSLLVIKTLPNHPSGLVPGDIVLGYDGTPWKKLYKEILAAQLPFFLVFPHPSNEKSLTHVLLKDAGMNWHLFDTLDVVKYSSADTVHFPTSVLAGQSGNLAGNEQLKIPGVPFPDINWKGVFNWDIYNQKNYVSWGIVGGTNIGYIYVYSWATPSQAPGSDIANEFFDAIDNLMNYHSVEGLILDTRFDFGLGQFDTDDPGLSLLFNSYIETLALDRRNNNYDHFEMRHHEQYTPARIAIPGSPSSFFDRPIAVLTGPGAFSMGDYIPQKMRFHPMVRIFGKSTAGAFSGQFGIRNPYSGWSMSIAEGNAYLVSDPDNYLSRAESHVDEEIWLTQEDVAKGEDTVVKRAIEWITNLTHAHDVTVDKTYAINNIDTVFITAQVENPNQHEISITANVENLADVKMDSLILYNDGAHGDGSAGNNIWGNFYHPPSEDFYTVSLVTNDLTDETSRILPKVAWFTTTGPVEIDSVSSVRQSAFDPTRFLFDIYLINEGVTATVTNVNATIFPDTTHPCFDRPGTVYRQFGDIDPAAIKAGLNFSFYLNETCSEDTVFMIPFSIKIGSGDYIFWHDQYEQLVDKLENRTSVQPLTFELEQNHPNPFNPYTVISWQLSVRSHLELSVYNLLGKKVATLVSERMNPGNHTFQFDGKNLASGVYYYQLIAGDYRDVKKMILLR